LFTRVEGGGHWKLDESSGPAADDADGDHDGTYFNGVLLGEPGAAPTTGTSVRLDGADDYIEIPPLNLNESELTITGWAKRDGFQSHYAGIVYSRGGTTLSGLSTLNVGYLSYTWNGAYYQWPSGLRLPDNEWAFFALVVRPDMATIYLGHAGVLESAANAALHGVEEFDHPLDLGRDNIPGRHFKGWLDDVRIYRAALSPRDIAGLYTRALVAGAGEVLDDALLLARAEGGDLLLSWDPSCLASDDDYAVYEGTVGDFTTHTDHVCSTSGATSITLSPAAGDRYYLVVPQSASREGSYGRDSEGNPREPGPSSCRPQEVAPCD
ncbi:MAG: LamG domain-containing protein, partial [Planctomycetota bacterium]